MMTLGAHSCQLKAESAMHQPNKSKVLESDLATSAYVKHFESASAADAFIISKFEFGTDSEMSQTNYQPYKRKNEAYFRHCWPFA